MFADATCLALSSVDEPVEVGGGAVDMMIEVKEKSKLRWLRGEEKERPECLIAINITSSEMEESVVSFER